MLRDLRTQAGLPLRIVAEQFATTPNRISLIERGLTRDPAIQTRIHAWLTDPQHTQIAA